MMNLKERKMDFKSSNKLHSASGRSWIWQQEPAISKRPSYEYFVKGATA
jgi:hypothetical protein